MRPILLAVPAVALLATAALAQSDSGSQTGSGMDGGDYGTNWPLSVGTTFFADDTGTTLRSPEELAGGWQSLSQEDRDMILADCETFLAADGSGAESQTDAQTNGQTDAQTTESPASGETATTADTDTATSAPSGYTMVQMTSICEAVGGL